MRIKKAFTLAEILIVLMVIGVIATMTVPSLMKGVNEAQFKTAYKKAFNAVTNIAAVEKIAGQLPTSNSITSAKNFFASLNSNLSVKEYDVRDLSSTELLTSDNTVTKVTWQGTTYGSTSTSAIAGTSSNNAESPWIITEDGLAYKVLNDNTIGDTGCNTKAIIMEQTSAASAKSNSCLVVAVDVNGLAKGPNKVEDQVKSGVVSSSKMNQLEGDRYYIFIGNDGVSAGPKSVTVSGRLMSDMK